MIRLFAGERPLESREIGLPVRVFDRSNAPSDGIWDTPVDFKAEYAKLWGGGS
jgi:hypothetical protein